MRTTKTIHVVSCHAEGEVGDVIVGGVAPPPGETLWEQSRWIARDGTPDEARDIAETGIRITKAANEQLGFTHPENTDWDHISFCQIAAPIEMRDGIATGRNAVAIRPAKIDRSPTGTGCSARLAVLHALGRLKVGDRFTGISLIGSEFHCTIAAETTVADRPAIIPTLAGRAWITGTHQHMLDPTDPWPGGHRLSDTWPRVG